MQSVPSAAADTSRAARTPKVFMKLDKHQVTTKQRAHVKIALSARSARSQERGTQRSSALGTGKVKVAIKRGASKSKLVGAKLVKGKAVVRLPKLARGTYKVRATFLGNALLGKARSETRTLRVVRAGGVDAARLCLDVEERARRVRRQGRLFPRHCQHGAEQTSKQHGDLHGFLHDQHGQRRDRLQGRQLPHPERGQRWRRPGAEELLPQRLDHPVRRRCGVHPSGLVHRQRDPVPGVQQRELPGRKYACGDTQNTTADCGVNGSNFTILRTEIININRAAYCDSNCLIQTATSTVPPCCRT